MKNWEQKKVTKRASLLLEDGSVYEGFSFGAETPAWGEVVFNTSMTGYQEILTDPSYAGQIVLATYPLIGNYGIAELGFESRVVQAFGFIVREHSTNPSHSLSTSTLHEFLTSQGIPGISGIDTRSLTRRLRSQGVMMGTITPSNAIEAAQIKMGNTTPYGEIDYVSRVTTQEPYKWTEGSLGKNARRPRIFIDDYGVKYNIMRILRSRGCDVVALPAKTSSSYILSRKPDGVILSPGPGDPGLLDYAVTTASELIGQVPILGICLGNQVLARAFGGHTFKLKFGHRGGNHPVRDLKTGRIHITAQNHGYSVDPESLPSDIEVTHTSLNDGTVEGLRHRSLPIMSIQYHSEASPGPLDNTYIFDQFLESLH